jgi:hypothetical protein
MAIIYESNLTGYPNSRSNLGISLGQTIKGSLTSYTNTIDDYNLILNQKTLVNLKFSVDQIVNEFDYYRIKTPVGFFYIHPNYNQIPLEGINFYIIPNYQNYSTISVIGSSNGVFRGGYTLQIEERPEPFYTKFIDPGNYFNKSESISANNVITAWFGGLETEPDYIKLSLPILPTGVTGKLIVYLNNSTSSYGLSSRTNQPFDISLYNEGTRFINSFTLEKGYSSITSNLTGGDYYIRIQGKTYVEPLPISYTFNIGFYTHFSDTKSVALNSRNNDFFSNWLNKLDTVIYDEPMSNFKINLLDNYSSELGMLTVSNKYRLETDKIQAERVVFSDKTIAFDFSSSEAGYKSAMLIAASFGKEYIPQFFSKGLSFFDSGSTTKEIAKLIADNKFIEQLIGDNSDSAWIKHVYKNVVGVYPDKASETNYVTLLQNKTNTRSELLELAAGFTFLETRIDLVGLQTNGLVFDNLS